jgi:hypothetical protein
MTLRHGLSGILATLGVVMMAGCGAQDVDAPAAPGVQLQDPYSSTGSLIVTMDDDGMLSVAIQGRIGTDSAALGQTAAAKSTLAEAYMVLHPDATAVPESIAGLSDKLAAQRKAALASLAPQELRPAANTISVPKDNNAFFANACQTEREGFSVYTPQSCGYMYNFHSLCTPSTIFALDRSVAWNESPYVATHSMPTRRLSVSIPAWYWNWTQFGGGYTGGAYACLTLPGGTDIRGNLGITVHRYSSDQVLIPVTE